MPTFAARAIVILVVAACSDSTGPGGSRIRVEPLAPLRMVGLRDAAVAELPALRVVDSSTRVPVAGRLVTYVLESPVGAKLSIPVKTGADGVAKLPSWNLGPALGRYVATATLEGWGPVIFTVLVPGNVVAVYDRTMINGNPAEVARVGEVHFVLYESGFVNYFFRVPDRPFTPAPQHIGTYTRSLGNQIEFRLECLNFFGQLCLPGGMSGVVSDSEMVIDRSDVGDIGLWLEVYNLR